MMTLMKVKIKCDDSLMFRISFVVKIQAEVINDPKLHGDIINVLSGVEFLF